MSIAQPEKVIFINSHPIQYFAPLYKYLNENGIPTECWYCSDENVKGHQDRQFGTKVQWDIPLLDGYHSRFFRNFSWKPSLYNGFFGLFNPGMLRALFREQPSVVVVHGWAYLTFVLVLVFARFAGHTVCLRGESPFNQEMLKSRAVRAFKKLLLQGVLFRFVHWFLYIGTQNKAFYRYYGVAEQKLLSVPYAVDNERFRNTAMQLRSRRGELRRDLGLAPEGVVILFAAKFIDKKRPLDLLAAFAKLNVVIKTLVMVGDGELRGSIEAFVSKQSLQNIHITGFINQSEIARYYAASDVFVLCSGIGETWGLSVNEAMNFDLPIVVSDIAGCASDLVKNGSNGFVFRTGDTEDLALKITDAIKLQALHAEILRVHSFASIATALRKLIGGEGY